MSKKGGKAKREKPMKGKKLMEATSASPDKRREAPPAPETPPTPAKKGNAKKPKTSAEVRRDVAPTTGTGSRQCTATAKQTGERCKRIPIPGGSVCVMHGGKTPAVQRSARGRLAELVMPAIETLNTERTNAKRSADRQRAANSILDRAGITRGHSAEIDAARSLLLERLLTLRAEQITPAPDPLELVATVVGDDDDSDEYDDDRDDRPDVGA